MPLAGRDDALLAGGLASWWASREPGIDDVEVATIDRPAAGWSNETVLVELSWRAGTAGRRWLVVRLPTPLPSFPTYDLEAQAAVQHALCTAGLPVPEPVAVELDERWVGSPFLVMERLPGRAVGEVPGIDAALLARDPAEQRTMHVSYADALAAVHGVDWRGAGLAGVLRGGEGDLGDELRWWRGYVEWAADGDPAPGLVEAVDWCAETAPPPAAPASLCWGDARMGNVLYDGSRLCGLLDWELASIGPAEMDVAWYLALDELTRRFVPGDVPGFLGREAWLERYEGRLGRPLEHLGWHQVFALVRSTAINDRQARLAAAAGVDYPGVAGPENPLLRYLAHQIEHQAGTP